MSIIILIADDTWGQLRPSENALAERPREIVGDDGNRFTKSVSQKVALSLRERVRVRVNEHRNRLTKAAAI